MAAFAVRDDSKAAKIRSVLVDGLVCVASRGCCGRVAPLPPSVGLGGRRGRFVPDLHAPFDSWLFRALRWSLRLCVERRLFPVSRAAAMLLWTAAWWRAVRLTCWCTALVARLL
jgi:hypothetical protein